MMMMRRVAAHLKERERQKHDLLISYEGYLFRKIKTEFVYRNHGDTDLLDQI